MPIFIQSFLVKVDIYAIYRIIIHGSFHSCIRVHLKLSLLFFALFFAIVMLRYEATQALQREMPAWMASRTGFVPQHDKSDNLKCTPFKYSFLISKFVHKPSLCSKELLLRSCFQRLFFFRALPNSVANTPLPPKVG